MSTISMLESKISRFQREIKRLEDQRTKEMKKESDAINKINRANKSIQRTKNTTTIQNKQREIQRENEKVQKAKESQAKLLGKISDSNMKLNKAISDLGKLRQKEQDKIIKEQEEKIKATKLSQQSVRDEIAATKTSRSNSTHIKEYDVFISHSADDKSDYVDKLVEALKIAEINIWYDSDSIGWGQSIRKEIDKGLAHSKFGIVIISPSFIEKYWTNYELDGILSKEGSTGMEVILPIWHKVTADEVKEYSLSLSNRLAMNSSINTLEEIVENVIKLVK